MTRKRSRLILTALCVLTFALTALAGCSEKPVEAGKRDTPEQAAIRKEKRGDD